MEAEQFSELIDAFSALDVCTATRIQFHNDWFFLEVTRTQLSAVLGARVVPEVDETQICLRHTQYTDDLTTYRIWPGHTADGVIQEAQIHVSVPYEEELSVRASTVEEYTHQFKELQRVLTAIRIATATN